MTTYTNITEVSLPIAVWLATDNYDGKSHTKDPYFVSATSLLKSPRQIILAMRIEPNDVIIDIASLVKSKIGTALHDSIEAVWTNTAKLPQVLTSLGWNIEDAKRVVVNPEIITEGSLPIYMEQRAFKKIGKWTLTGKFDFIIDGHLHDFKSTGTFTFSNKTKDDDYIKQGSIYRWLNPTKITDDTMSIDFIFTDWKQGSVVQHNYPPSQTYKQDFPLMSIEDTEEWLTSRLDLIETFAFQDEDKLPQCTDKELWRRESIWKYYKSGKVETRSTKNFETAAEAYERKTTDGGKGLVLEIKGAPTACMYCNVSSICTQKDAFIHAGELVL